MNAASPDPGPTTRTETYRYGYHPEYPETARRFDRDRSGTRDLWVILCTVPGAVGPFDATRTVTYSPWVYPEKDASKP